MKIEDIKKGESDSLEFKREFPDKEKKVLKTIVAFANGNGGNIIIGIDDKTFDIIDVNDDEVFKIKDKISNSISDNISPQIIPQISFERIEDKTVIIINIAKGQNTPYCIKSEGLEGVYIRVDATTRAAERYKIQELSLLGMNKTFDEIVSPGGLIGGLTIQDILDGRSSVRNEVLADAFLKMRLVEHWGTGLKRIREICAENDIEEPMYKSTSAFFAVTVKRKSYAKKNSLKKKTNEGLNEGLNLSDKEQKILSIIKEKGQISSKEIIGTTGFSHATVERAAKRLSEELLLIKREGSKKTGYWKINTEK